MSEYESENGCDPYDECWIAVNSQTEGELAVLKNSGILLLKKVNIVTNRGLTK